MANNQLLASDNFASCSLAAGWSAWPNLSESVVVVGSPNVTQPSTTSATQGEYWTGSSFPTDQICEVTIQNLATTGAAAIALAVRFQNVSNSSRGYAAICDPTQTTDKIIIDRYDAGGPTRIGGTGAAAVTFSAGDVITFAAIGSLLIVYKNNVLMCYAGDATYTSGTCAMFVQSNSSAASSAQISAFRGYSVQQQDGVWTKRGCVLPANATELAASPSGNTGFLGVSFGAARFLSGNVWRGYFSYGANVGYAESSDGVIWTRYSSNPISSLAGYVGVDVFFYNGTYYLWAQATQGSSTATLFTSTDGLTWTNQGNTNLPSGTGYYYGLHVADVISGSFYALFSKLDGTNGNKPSTYLATSPVADGKTWTVQNSGNPVIVGTFCGFQIVKSGSKYYFWATQNQPGQGATNPNFDPYEAVRYSSSNLVTWTAESHSLHKALLSDSLNSNQGGVAATSIITVNGQSYLYYQGSPSDAASPQIYQTMLAVAPVPIASVVLFPEDAVQYIATDSFNRSPGGLGSNWTTVTGKVAPQIASSGVVEPNSQVNGSVAYYSGASFGSNQFSELTIHASASTSEIDLIVRAQPGSITYYVARVSISALGTANACALNAVVNGVQTALFGGGTQTASLSDVFRLMVTTGSDGFPVLSMFQNGFLLYQVTDYGNRIPSGGFPGIVLFDSAANANAQISSWAGGNANVIPMYPPSPSAANLALFNSGLGFLIGALASGKR